MVESYFSKNKKTGKWMVIGDELVLGINKVRKRDGFIVDVYINAISSSFICKYGPLIGKKVRIGTIEQEFEETEPPYKKKDVEIECLQEFEGRVLNL